VPRNRRVAAWWAVTVHVVRRGDCTVTPTDRHCLTTDRERHGSPTAAVSLSFEVGIAIVLSADRAERDRLAHFGVTDRRRWRRATRLVHRFVRDRAGVRHLIRIPLLCTAIWDRCATPSMRASVQSL